MVSEETTYEQSLETMNEEGLRAECVRLKKELDAIQVQQLTQTKPVVSMFPGEKEAVLTVISVAERYGYGSLVSQLKQVLVVL